MKEEVKVRQIAPDPKIAKYYNDHYMHRRQGHRMQQKTSGYRGGGSYWPKDVKELVETWKENPFLKRRRH